MCPAKPRPVPLTPWLLAPPPPPKHLLLSVSQLRCPGDGGREKSSRDQAPQLEQPLRLCWGRGTERREQQPLWRPRSVWEARGAWFSAGMVSGPHCRHLSPHSALIPGRRWGRGVETLRPFALLPKVPTLILVTLTWGLSFSFYLWGL